MVMKFNPVTGRMEDDSLESLNDGQHLPMGNPNVTRMPSAHPPTPDMEEQEPSSLPPPNLMSLMADALKNKDEQLLVGRLGKSAQQLAQAASTNKIPLPSDAEIQAEAESGVDTVGKLAKLEKDTSEFASEQQMRDPNSDISKSMREYAKNKLNMKFKDNVNAAQLEKLGIKIVPPSTSASRFQQVARLNPETGSIELHKFDTVTGEISSTGNNIKGFKAELKEDKRTGDPFVFHGGDPKFNAPENILKEEKPTKVLKVTDFNPTTQKIIVEQRKVADKETKETKDILDAATVIRQELTSNKKDDDILRSIQTRLSTLAGNVGAKTEADVAGFGKRPAFLSSIYDSLTYTTTGNLSDGNRKFLLNYAKKLEDGTRTAFEDRLEVPSKRIQNDAGISKEQAYQLLGYESSRYNLNKKQGEQAPASKEVSSKEKTLTPEISSSSETIEMLTPNGKPIKVVKSKEQEALKRGLKYAK